MRSRNTQPRQPFIHHLNCDIYHISNAFRVDVIYRLTYRNSPGANIFGISVLAWINF